MIKTTHCIVIIIACFAVRTTWAVPSIDEMWQTIQEQQKMIEALQHRLAAMPPPPADAEKQITPREVEVAQKANKKKQPAAMLEQGHSESAGWWNSIEVGGYGSTRFEAGSLEQQHPGFTHRRIVLELEAQPLDSLQTKFELEFERFTELGLEKWIGNRAGKLKLSQAIEGSDETEISVEQAWARLQLTPALQVDVGALLVPVGRFNIEQDDNEWVLPRRSLVDRGTPVLPVAAAWTEAGAGISGSAALGGVLVDYQLYALNGMTIDFGVEQELEIVSGAGQDTELESVLAAEFGPARGSFAGNNNDSMAFAGRLGLHPAPGHEIALSGYVGNYVPSFLGRHENVWSLGIDGLHHVGGFEVEYEAVTTHFDGLLDVAHAFADHLLSGEREINGNVDNAAFATHKIEFSLSQNKMARVKTGYWLEIRRPIHIDLFNDTLFGNYFPEQMLIPVFRMEQVYFDDQLQGIEFDGAKLTAYKTRNASVSRATLGLGYRPVPGWIVQLAGEYTWTGADSLAGLTNYLPAGGTETDNFSLLLGAAFGF